MNKFCTPLPFIEPALRKHLLFLLRHSVQVLTSCNQDYLHLSRLRVRSLSVHALALGLPAQRCTVNDLFTAAHIAPSHEELPNLAALVADKFVLYRSQLPPHLTNPVSPFLVGMSLRCHQPTNLRKAKFQS